MIIDVVDAVTLNGALRTAEEVGWARCISATLDVLTELSRTATPAEMAVIHDLALRFAECSAKQYETVRALRDAAAPGAKALA